LREGLPRSRLERTDQDHTDLLYELSGLTNVRNQRTPISGDRVKVRLRRILLKNSIWIGGIARDAQRHAFGCGLDQMFVELQGATARGMPEIGVLAIAAKYGVAIQPPAD